MRVRVRVRVRVSVRMGAGGEGEGAGIAVAGVDVLGRLLDVSGGGDAGKGGIEGKGEDGY